MAGRTTTERGYGAEHQRLRAQWAPIVEAGEANCGRCGGAIDPDEPWELDHTDDRQDYNGPAHMDCNRDARWGRSARGADAGDITAQRVSRVSQEW